jgi:hypothetical protein
MVGVRVSWVGTLKDLGVGILIVELGHWLDGIDDVVSWSVVALPPPKVVLPTLITIVIMAITVVIAPIISAVIVAPIITPVIRAAILLVRSRSPANVFLDLLVGLVSVCLLLHLCEQVLDLVGPLAEQLGPESIMVAEASDERGDSFITIDVRDGYPYFREVADVATQWFIWIVSDFLQIILVGGC